MEDELLLEQRVERLESIVQSLSEITMTFVEAIHGPEFVNKIDNIIEHGE